jgi:predicted unusual protein kinase regulating ubiquinone biosynthesis (AarF/ABC1/UbiB family)
MLKVINQILFFVNIGFIVSSEIVFYTIFNDYLRFIHNITHRLASVNILYVKLFQSIASNNKLIDEKTNNELLKFTDKAPWNYSDIRLYELIEIVDRYDLILTKGFESPINSGMISLVYKAIRKSDNKDVIIKMKRNNIENTLNTAIENLKLCIYLLSFIPIVHKYKIADIVNKNIEIIYHQLNFNEEVENIITIRNNCKNLKYVKIPEVYEDVTKEYPNFIMMEYINGIKINDIKEEDYYNFAKQILKFGFVTTIVHGSAHGDLHSGNILFIKDDDDKKYPYKIGVIDFGIVFKIDDDYKETLFTFLTNIFEIPTKDSIKYILNSSFFEPKNVINHISEEHYNIILDIGSKMLDDILIGSKKPDQYEMFNFLSKFLNCLNNPMFLNYEIRICDSFIKMQLVIAMAHGVTFTLCKDNILELSNEVLNGLFHTNILIDY